MASEGVTTDLGGQRLVWEGDCKQPSLSTSDAIESRFLLFAWQSVVALWLCGWVALSWYHARQWWLSQRLVGAAAWLSWWHADIGRLGGHGGMMDMRVCGWGLRPLGFVLVAEGVAH